MLSSMAMSVMGGMTCRFAEAHATIVIKVGLPTTRTSGPLMRLRAGACLPKALLKTTPMVSSHAVLSLVSVALIATNAAGAGPPTTLSSGNQTT